MIRAWNRFWFAPTSANPLAALRILFGLIVLLHLALLVPDVEAWFTDAGRLQGAEARQLAGPAWSSRFPVPMRWSPLQNYRTVAAVQGVLAATAVVAILFLLGWRTRIMGVLLYAGLMTIHHANILTTSGADVLLMILSFYLMLSPCGAAYSLDSRRQAKTYGGAYSALVAPWTQRLIAIQISVVYLMTAFLKAQGKNWSSGTALHFILNNGEARRFTLGLTSYPAILNAMTFGTMFLEVALGLLLWVRAARPLMIILGLALHGGITLTINIPIFGELMAACYLSYLSAQEWDSISRCLDPRRLWRKAAAQTTIPGRVDVSHAGNSAGPYSETRQRKNSPEMLVPTGKRQRTLR